MKRIMLIALAFTCACAIAHIGGDCETTGLAIGHASVRCYVAPEPTAIADYHVPAWAVTPKPIPKPDIAKVEIKGGNLSSGFTEMVSNIITGFLAWWAS